MEKVIAKLDSFHQQLLEIITPLDEAMFERRPSPGEWSVAENVHHIRIVEENVLKEVEKKLALPPEELSLFGKIFQVPAWTAGLRTIKVKAPKYVEPLNPPPKKETIDNLNRVRNAMKDIMKKHGRERLLRTVIKHPILGNFDGVNMITFVGYHELRHLKQIREVVGKLKK